ncbi:MAG: response regulator transcription factor [Gammaproteobacteria bacterium]|nr:response regulator transcription factor [Gammaproteobacteria bacterium]
MKAPQEPEIQPHLCVVDDDSEVRKMLLKYFEAEGFRVTALTEGTTLRNLQKVDPADVILLDVRLPGMDGMDLLRTLKREFDTPIILVSGKSDLSDKVLGLELGADDYVTKPFELREVLARVRAVIRRRSGERSHNNGADDMDDPVIQFAGWSLNTASMEVVSENNGRNRLTAQEYNLLSAFIRRSNRVLSREKLMDLVGGHDWIPGDRRIDVLIGRLRRKIGDDPKNPKTIRTVHGLGYMLKQDKL